MAEWKSDQNLPPKFEELDLEGASENLKAVVKWLYMHAQDHHTWGKMVRADIVRLEQAAGMPKGDPGDPPGGPPNGDE